MPYQVGQGEECEAQARGQFQVPVGHQQDMRAAQVPPGSQDSWLIHSCRPTDTGAIPISHVPVASSRAEKELSPSTVI